MEQTCAVRVGMIRLPHRIRGVLSTRNRFHLLLSRDAHDAKKQLPSFSLQCVGSIHSTFVLLGGVAELSWYGRTLGRFKSLKASFAIRRWRYVGMCRSRLMGFGVSESEAFIAVVCWITNLLVRGVT